MNKAQELEALRGFIESLPRESYLRDALTASAPFFSAAMRADVPFNFAEQLRAIGGDLRESRAMLAELGAKIKAARDELAKLQRDRESARRDLAEYSKQLGDLSNAVSSAHYSAQDAARKAAKAAA